MGKHSHLKFALLSVKSECSAQSRWLGGGIGILIIPAEKGGTNRRTVIGCCTHRRQYVMQTCDNAPPYGQHLLISLFSGSNSVTDVDGDTASPRWILTLTVLKANDWVLVVL